MKFGEILKQTRPGLVVSPRHEAWMAINSNPVYSPEALAFGAKEMLKQATPRDRRGSVSASSVGKCIRQQQFTYLGMPEGTMTAKGAQILLNGTFMHIRWQMAGLTEGWLVRAEVPVGRNHLTLDGTIDGIAYDGSVVEFKSINTHGFSSVQTFGPRKDHVFQVVTYMVATGAEKGSIIYEDKNTQEYSEHIVLMDDEHREMVAQQADNVWSAINDHELVEPLSKCIDKEGYVYKFCPFHQICLQTKSWEHAKEIAR